MKIIVPSLKTQATAPGPVVPSCLERGLSQCQAEVRPAATQLICNPRTAHDTNAKFRNMAFCHKREQKGTERNMENLSLYCFVAWLFKNPGSSAVKTPMNLQEHRRNPHKHWLLTQLNRFIQIYTCFLKEHPLACRAEAQ